MGEIVFEQDQQPPFMPPAGSGGVLFKCSDGHLGCGKGVQT